MLLMDDYDYFSHVNKLRIHFDKNKDHDFVHNQMLKYLEYLEEKLDSNQDE